MRRLLIVSPVLPPANSPDMHRVRTSLPYFHEFGWEPHMLTVDPALTERVIDPALEETVPRDVPVHRVKAFDPKCTRKLGFSAIGLRAFPFLYREGARLIRENKPDLVYFSTTAFPVLALGRMWKRRFGVPFVIDLQDPWVGDYYDKQPGSQRPPKYALAQFMHRRLESFTMCDVGGIIAVSDAYHESLRKRYPWIEREMCRTIPFGASEKDFEVAGRVNWENPFFNPSDGLFHGVCVGALGRTKVEICRAVCVTIKNGLEKNPELFSKLRLHFVGTDYAPARYARETIRPMAVDHGLEKHISEQTARIPYLSALRLCRESDFLLVLGSDDPHYTASKIYPYILVRKPMLSVFREESSVIRVMKETNAGMAVSFGPNDNATTVAGKISTALTQLLQELPFTPSTDWKAFEPYSARQMTKKQCELFDLVVAHQPATSNRPPPL